MIDRIANLQWAIETKHKCKARHVEDNLVIELYRGDGAWDGAVAVFDLTGHPRATRCYAWYYDDKGEPQFMSALEIPPVDSAETAVKIAVAAKAKEAKTIVYIASTLAWIPAMCLFASSQKLIALLIPVMGLCPFSDRSGEYDERDAYIWGISLLVVFAALGIFAIAKKSKSLAKTYAILLGISVLFDIFRLVADSNTPTP